MSEAAAVESITPFDVLFNKVAIVDINFFNIKATGAGEKSTDIVDNIRVSVASWYYIMRTFACAILLVILVYVGIRMAITTIASDKAMYNKMLVDWVCSLALIFILQYIIIFCVNLNSVFVNALSNVADGTDLKNAIVEIRNDSMGINVNAIASTIVFVMLVVQTLGLLISYINRMLKIAFLIIIAPLITLTYSIDKMGDGKAQALGNWLREFIFTILIQPFHCIIYMAFVSMAFNLLTDKKVDSMNSLAGAIIAVLCILFTKDAEKIVRKIFGFKDENSSTSIAVGMAATAMAVSKAKSVGQSARKTVNGVKNFTSSAGEKIGNARVEAAAAAAFLADGFNNSRKSAVGDSADSTRKSFADYKQEKKDQFDEKKAAKYHSKSRKGEIEKLAKQKLSTQKNITPEIRDTARKEAAKEVDSKYGSLKGADKLAYSKKNYDNQKRENFAKRHPTLNKINGVRGRIKEIKNSSETLKELSAMRKTVVAGGVGMFAGSATLGTTGNFGQALAIGGATANSVKEFSNTSSKDLANDVNEKLRTMGVNNSEGASDAMDEIISKGNSGDFDTDDELNDLVRNIENQLKNLGISTKDENGANVSNKIKNKISSNLANNPNMSIQAAAKSAIKTVLPNNPSVAANPVLNAAATAVASLQQQKNIYQIASGATKSGLNANAFSKDVSKSFISAPTTNDGSYASQAEKIMDDYKTETMSDETAATTIEGKTEDDVKGITDEMDITEKSLKSMADTLREISPNDSKIDELTAEANQIFENRQKLIQAALERDFVIKQEALNEQFAKLSQQLDDAKKANDSASERAVIDKMQEMGKQLEIDSKTLVLEKTGVFGKVKTLESDKPVKKISDQADEFKKQADIARKDYNSRNHS